MRAKFTVGIALVGIALAASWYVFALDVPPQDILNVAPNSVLTSTKVNEIINLVNTLRQILEADLDHTPRTIQVDCNAGQTIGQVLQDADGGDTIRVTGTCRETVVIHGSGLTLDGQGTAIIEAGGQDGIVVESARGVMITGFTVQNGNLGILGTGGAALRLTNVTVQNSAAEGIRIENNSTAWLKDCNVLNSILDGISVLRTSSATIDGNVTSTGNRHDGMRVLESSTVSSLNGAMIVLDNNSAVGLRVGNSSHFGDFNTTLSIRNNQGAEGGVHVFNASSVEINAEIKDNLNGSGVFLENGSSGRIQNATISGNGVGNTGGESSGVSLRARSSARIENATITGNRLDGVSLNDGSSAVIVNSMVNTNSEIGVSVENGSIVTIENSTSTGNGTDDLEGRFGSFITLIGTNTIVNTTCPTGDLTVFIRIGIDGTPTPCALS